MKRLNFELPQFCKIAWVSDNAKEVWMPRINQVIKAWREIEWTAIVEGLRQCAAIPISPEYLISLGEKCAKNNLLILPLGYQGIQNYSYCNNNMEENPKKNFLLNVVVGTSQDVLSFKAASESDPDQVLKLLGYPQCCCNFLRIVLEKGQMDTTWPMIEENIKISQELNCSIEVVASPFLNILLRWIGIRAIPHLPCSFCCKESIYLAKRYVSIGRKLGYNHEMDWLLEILGWPIQWSALHGIAEIKTPILKISTQTEATPGKYTVSITGDLSPEEGASGLSFPYRIPNFSNCSEKKGNEENFQKPSQIVDSSSHQNQVRDCCEKWYYEDNGFKFLFDMDSAHRTIEELVIVTLSAHSVNVLDLGCGNGVLLKKIKTIFSKIIPFGVDNDHSRIEHAHILLPEFKDNFVIGDLSSFHLLFPNNYFGIIMIALSRLEEMEIGRRVAFGKQLADHCNNILVYDYWGRNIEEVATRIGVQLLSYSPSSRASLAKFCTSQKELVDKTLRNDSNNNVQRKEFYHGLFHSDHSNHGDYPYHDDIPH